MEPIFKYCRLYTSNDGESHFDEIEMPLRDNGDIGWLSEPLKAKDLIFRKVDFDYDYDFHIAPDRQFIFFMDGEIEIETSLGDKRKFAKGDVLLLEDTTGKGHRTRNTHSMIRSSIFIRFLTTTI